MIPPPPASPLSSERVASGAAVVLTGPVAGGGPESCVSSTMKRMSAAASPAFFTLIIPRTEALEAGFVDMVRPTTGRSGTLRYPIVPGTVDKFSIPVTPSPRLLPPCLLHFTL